jgi:hypothetical protein
MSPIAAARGQPEDREGLSPSPEAFSPGVVTIAGLLDDDNDDIEFEPSTERSESSEWVDEDDGGDDEEYVGMVKKSGATPIDSDSKQMHKMI